MIKKHLIYFFLFSIRILFAQNELPFPFQNEEIIKHSGFTLSYNENYEQASWVAYELTADELIKRVKRSDNFKKDSKVSTGSALPSDYAKSGYDRGHLAPAADLSWSEVTMKESFFMSNMSPQKPGFNRGVWKKLEGYVRQWASDNGSIYVVTGGVLKDIDKYIGTSNVGIPKYYYKVILDYTGPEKKGIGFILPNQSSSKKLQLSAVSIDEVEALTGIDFFHALPDNEENLLESQFDLNQWRFKNYVSKSNMISSTTSIVDSLKGNFNSIFPSSTVAQCNGITKSGNRCKRKTSNASGFCYMHD
jgi:endonuclease G